MHPQQLEIGGGLVRQRQGKNHKVDRHQADRLPQVRDRRRFGEAKTGKEPQGRQAPGRQTSTGKG